MLLGTTSHSDTFEWFLILIVLYGAFWWFFFRPRMKRQKAARTASKSFEVGDRIQTIGGLVATVTDIGDFLVTLRTDDGASLQFVKAAIGQRYVEPIPPETRDTDDHGVGGGAN